MVLVDTGTLLGWESCVSLLEGGVSLLGDGSQIGTLGDLVPVKVCVDGVVGNNDRGSDVDVVVVVDNGHVWGRNLDRGGHHRHVDVVVRGGGHDNGGRSHSSGALVGADGGGGASLVGPGVGGEPR